jgi:ribosomal protein S18 acetylase RimI-like enzyme
MNIEIRQISESDIVGFQKCLDSVAQEGKYLAIEKAPDLERLKSFINNNINNNFPQFVAIENDIIVGWCEAIPFLPASVRHRSGLVIGVVKEMRGKGIGEKLLIATIDHAKEMGIKRIDLEVRIDNENAINLYRKIGFKEYARKKLGLFHEGKFHDLIAMEYLQQAI